MNESRQVYLDMYFNIECIGHLIQNEKITYRTRKYYHSLMTRVKSLAVVVVYGMYPECT